MEASLAFVVDIHPRCIFFLHKTHPRNLSKISLHTHILIYVTHHAKRVPWVKIFDTGCLPDSGRVQSWEQYGVKILEIF